MSANNTEMNMIIADVVPEVEAVQVLPDELLPVTMAELLEEDFGGDDEAEFLQGVLDIQNEIENVILSDNPEEFLLPTEDDLPPIFKLLEKLDELKGYKFADRTLARMERRVRGENEVVRPFISETEKLNNPAYKKCPYCPARVKNLKRHIKNRICRKVGTGQVLRPAEPTKRKVDDKIYAVCLDLSDLIERSIQYKKNIEPELEEEDFEDNNKVYVIKTFEYNHTTKAIDYAGLWEDSETGNKEFKTEEEAREQFGYATEGDKGYIAVELVEIDPDSEVRENVIEEWEDNIDDYTYDWECETCGTTGGYNEDHYEVDDDAGLTTFYCCEDCSKK